MELEVGQKTPRETTVTEAMAQSWAEITGDCNPLHLDEELISRNRFDGLMSQGGVTTGLLQAPAATDFPDPDAVFLSQV